MTTEHDEKTRRVLALMDEQDLDVLLLRSPGGAAWWSGGGRTHIPATPEVGVATLVLRRDGDAVRTTVVTAVIEAPRLQAEELAASGRRVAGAAVGDAGRAGAADGAARRHRRAARGLPARSARRWRRRGPRWCPRRSSG